MIFANARLVRLRKTYAVLRERELFPKEFETMLGAFDLENKEKYTVVLLLDHIADYSVNWVLCLILQPYVVSKLRQILGF